MTYQDIEYYVKVDPCVTLPQVKQRTGMIICAAQGQGTNDFI